MQDKHNWQVPEEIPELDDAGIHVWKASVKDFTAKQFWPILSRPEKTRANRFVFSEHQDRFIIARGILRNLLAGYLHIKPENLSFTTNKFGKPEISSSYPRTRVSVGENNYLPVKDSRIRGNDKDFRNDEDFGNDKVHFNISHSRDLILFAFAKNHDIGVDIEFINKDINLDIAERFFSAHEVQALLKLPAAQQSRAFFNCWTRKEAFIKAIGKGLSFPLHKFDVDISSDKNSLLLDIHDAKYKPLDWKIFNLNVAKNYAAALSCSTKSSQMPVCNLYCSPRQLWKASNNYTCV